MSRSLTPALALLAALALAPLAAAQGVGPNAERVQAAQTLAETQGGAVRWDGETGAPARIELERARLLTGELAAATARWLEQDLAALFEGSLRAVTERELAPLGSALVLREVRDLGRGRARVIFDQCVSGVKVQDASLGVEVEQRELGWQPVRVVARYFLGL
ncbi:MAG TPA: hypothetical protein DEA08_17450, partial [Planctomycetes bacterium]|nr:hypothetical protein [Planctomycetota bacterium]